ncbi:MAG: hypothetical protein PHR16_13265 [Methylovulum sp.]|nr:hypothetical protein [Methylovulum sp.]
MNFAEIIKHAKALADEEEQYKLHVRYKQEICAIVGIPPTGEIPQTLTPMQTARLVMPDYEKTQKIIAYSLKEKYGHREIYNDDQVLTEAITELATVLNIALPGVVHWWLNGARPRYAICYQPQAFIGNNGSSQAAVESANTNRIENMDKFVSVQQERETMILPIF